MAEKGRRGEPTFFIYDHNMLKKEEDDLKDAILYFTPEHVSADDQCALCGQLMGMTEFLGSTLCQSNPQLFKFEYEKFALKRRGSYSFAVQSNNFTPDSLLINQLRVLYATFVTFHGSVDSVRLRYKDSHAGFLQELAHIWRTILQVTGVSLTTNLTLTFHALPYLQLPQRGSHLFLQASHLLQSSQRRPYVLAGAIFYKNRVDPDHEIRQCSDGSTVQLLNSFNIADLKTGLRYQRGPGSDDNVLSTQLSPTLTRQLTFLQNQMPHVARTVEFDLPVGCRIITIFLHDDELKEISQLDVQARRHCKITNFTAKRDSENKAGKDRSQPVKKRNLSRRLTCPNLGSPTPKQSANQAGESTLQTFLTNEKRRSMYRKEPGVVSVDHKPWSKERRTKVSLSHVPIVECGNDELSAECDENSYANSQRRHFDETYKQIEMNTKFENESSEESTSDEESHSADSAKVSSDNTTESVNKSSGQTKHVTKSHENVTSDQTHTGDCRDGVVAGQLAQTRSGKLKVQSDGETSNVGPSISDLEDDSDHDTVTEGSNGSKRNSARETSSSIDSSKTVLEEAGLDYVSFSTSSDSVRESRFYDKLPDDETAIVQHGSSHSIHNHIADVHIDAMSSSDNSTELRKHTGEQIEKVEKNFEHATGDGTAIYRIEEDLSYSTELRKHTGEQIEKVEKNFEHATGDGTAIYRIEEDQIERNCEDEDSSYQTSVSSTTTVNHGKVCTDKHVETISNADDYNRDNNVGDVFCSLEAGGKGSSGNQHSSTTCRQYIHKENNTRLSKMDGAIVHQDLSVGTRLSKMDGAIVHQDLSVGTRLSKMDGAIVHQDLSVEQESQPTPLCASDMERKETPLCASDQPTPLCASDMERKETPLCASDQPTPLCASDMERKETHSEIFGDKEHVGPSTEYKDLSALDNEKVAGVFESDMETEDECIVETEDEGVVVEYFTPCINCLEAASLQDNAMAASTVIKCAQCLLKPKIIKKDGVQQEVIDFSQNPEAGTESEIQTDAESEMNYTMNPSGGGITASSSFSSNVSTDSTISRYWSTEMDGLNDVTLYVQCHSDISLLLLMENPEHYQEDLLHSLWKGSLAHLADLDYYIKECMEGEDSGGVNLYTYARFDPFTGKLQGNIEEGLSSKQEEDHLNQMMASLHTEFQHRHCLTDVTLSGKVVSYFRRSELEYWLTFKESRKRSQVSSCYGHRNHVEETYFHPTGQQRFASGLPIPKDSVYSLDTVAQQRLTRDKKMPIL